MLPRTFQESNHILSPYDILTLVTSLLTFSTWEKGYCKTVEVAFSEHPRLIPLVFEEKKRVRNNFILWNKTCREIEDQHWIFLSFFTEESLVGREILNSRCFNVINNFLQLVAEIFSQKMMTALPSFFFPPLPKQRFLAAVYEIPDKIKRVLFLTIDKFQFFSLKLTDRFSFNLLCYLHVRTICGQIYTRNRPFAAKPSRDLLFIKLWAATLRIPEMEKACRKHQNGQVWSPWH